MTANETALAVRLPHTPAIQQNFGVDVNTWKVLVEAVWPEAQCAESVIMALSYCKARNLDPLKRVVHIVPIWNKAKGKMVDTVWPGIAEIRTTAARTKTYAGRDATIFGPDVTMKWQREKGPDVEVTFPKWAQITVYRFVEGQRVAFAGPAVHWLETFAATKDGSPNSMWQKRPRGQLDKCAERAALATAFPEESGDDFSEADGPGMYQHMESNTSEPMVQMPQRKSLAGSTPAPAPTAQDAADDGPTEELRRYCQGIADAGMTPATADYKTFRLERAEFQQDADSVCKQISSFIGKKNEVVEGRAVADLTGKWLSSTLRRAKELHATIPAGEQEELPWDAPGEDAEADRY